MNWLFHFWNYRTMESIFHFSIVLSVLTDNSDWSHEGEFYFDGTDRILYTLLCLIEHHFPKRSSSFGSGLRASAELSMNSIMTLRWTYLLFAGSKINIYFTTLPTPDTTVGQQTFLSATASGTRGKNITIYIFFLIRLRLVTGRRLVVLRSGDTAVKLASNTAATCNKWKACNCMYQNISSELICVFYLDCLTGDRLN